MQRVAAHRGPRIFASAGALAECIEQMRDAGPNATMSATPGSALLLTDRPGIHYTGHRAGGGSRVAQQTHLVRSVWVLVLEGRSVAWKLQSCVTHVSVLNQIISIAQTRVVNGIERGSARVKVGPSRESCSIVSTSWGWDTWCAA
jgi:hypothetical protein